MKRKLVGLMLLTSVGGCTAESTKSPDDDATSSPSTSSATLSGGGGATATSTQATASASTGDVSTSASTTGAPSGECNGAFGEPVVLFTAEMSIPQSFTITPDELELYYVNDLDGERIIERRVRSSRTTGFGPGEPVSELLDVCPSVNAAFAVGTVDLSPDGLVAYIACEEDVTLPTTLVTARRTSLGGAFTPDPTPLGMVGASFATADGLEGFSNTPAELAGLDRHQRASLAVPFGTAERLSIQLRGPDPSNDGLWLFGSVAVGGGTSEEYQLAAAARSDLASPFGEPSAEGFPTPPAGFSDYTPTISADCRSLYFLRLGESSVFSVMLAQR